MISMEIIGAVLLTLLLVWVISNIIRYAMKKSGGTGGWFGLSDAWIKADAPPAEQPKVETKGKEKK
jgi:hypothetical protein